MAEVQVNGVYEHSDDNNDPNTLRAELFTSSTKRRTYKLHMLGEQIKNQRGISVEESSTLLRFLVGTYAFYVDRSSRQAVQECLRALLVSPQSGKYLEYLAAFLQNERSKAAVASSSLFVLVEWCSVVLQEISSRPDLWDAWGLKIVESQAELLEKFVGSNDRESRRNSSMVTTRRGIRAIAKSTSLDDSVLGHAIEQLTSKGSSSKAPNAVLLGVIAGVCDRISSKRPVLQAHTSNYYSFYTREILGSRSVLPHHIANGLQDFFASSVTIADDFEKEIAPAAERSLLRAPEVVLNDLLRPLVDSLPSAVDLSMSLKKHLLKPILSNVKSTNQTIKDGALSAFEKIVSKCEDQTVMSEAANDVLAALKDAKSADHRTLYALMLGVIPLRGPSSRKFLSGIASLAAKEANESALNAESKALSVQIVNALSEEGALDSSVSKAFVQGIGDKKPSTRKIWALQFGLLVWSLETEVLARPAAIQLLEDVIPTLGLATEEVVANPVSAAQTGSGTVANVFVAICTSKLQGSSSEKVSSAIKKARTIHNAPGTDTKPSFLTNHRVYTKFTSEEDQLWFARALLAVDQPSSDGTKSALLNVHWGLAVLFLLTATFVASSVRREVNEQLQQMCIKQPSRVPTVLVDSLWQWLRNVVLDEKDTPAQFARSDQSRIHLVFQSLCQAFKASIESMDREKSDVIQLQLVRLLVPCRQPLTPRVKWIDLCLRSGIDPETLVSNHATQCMDEVAQHAQRRSDQYFEQVYKAACDSAADLAFVAPVKMTPLITEMIANDLDPAQLSKIGPTEAAIYRTPDGTTFVDVLSSKAQDRLPDKKSKDYDILKWEQELRDQLASKQGRDRKLTVDEQTKVKLQLEKETGIRKSVEVVEKSLRRGIGIVSSLARGPPTDGELWIGAAVRCLIGVIKGGAGLVVGDAAAMAYLACADMISPRLGSLRTFVGVATLRAQGSSQLPPMLEEENLGDLVTRVLYRLRFSGEQRPFDVVSLTYMLPLISLVLENGGIGKPSSDDADEQITLGLEFLSFHTDLFSNPRLPREQVTSLLIKSMQRYKQHYKLLKDCLLGLCNALAPDATDSEISVFLRGSIVPESTVRNCSLQAIDTELNLHEGSFCVEILLACHEANDENVEIANTIWEENQLQTEAESYALIIPYLEKKAQPLRLSAARALVTCVEHNREVLTTVLDALQSWYADKAKAIVPGLDAYGMPRKVDTTDLWEARHGIALAFNELAPEFEDDLIVPFVRFLVEKGPLADKDERVRDRMIDAGRRLISSRGQARVEDLMQIFETTLEAPDSGSQDHDKVNEAVIILYGALARHLKSGDERIQKVIDRLLTSLKTPSETVQYAIAGCLPPLIQNSRSEASNYLQSVMSELLHSKKYAARRGAAYGLAALVQGCGVSALREFRISSSLRAASEEKKDQNQRQGAFLAYELLSLILGRVFEPYVVLIVPQLLAGFGDSSADVREACLDAAKTCFATLSSFGVKQVLPTLLEGLKDQQWRSKKGACDSLGAMAYLDPQQLAISLPDIIPPLTNVLNDSHKEVRGSANRSLQRFGDVISNPEIKSLVDILLKALSDPTKYTEQALDSLLKISFVHYLDAPSLALVVRILERGLGDRSATKRKASQVIGSLAHLTERKDLVPNLPILVSGLRVASVDPVPATRATSSKALGSLVEKLGEDALPDLIPSLMAALKTDTGAGDRLGSAQALSEVLAGLGVGRLEETLPSILQNVSSAKAAVREGFMSLFIFLPACFGNSFANYLSRIIPPILSGLADEVESIRDTSLRAGRLLVKNFATRAIDLLLPELQRGLADDNHRIRLSSVELVGDLLFNLTGISANEEEEGGEETATAAGQSLLEVLGEEKRNNVLSALYISRCDTSGLVRAAAINVWKALVATPRTLREITPTLTQLIIRRLASSNMEQKVIAGNAFGELIRKATDSVLASLLPTLEEGLQSHVDTDAKQGICIALRELISSASVETLEDYEPKLISVIRTALVDHSPEVRETAAEAFDSLQRMFGKRVVDQILPNLLGMLQNEDEAENALAALLTLLTEHGRSNIILPSLLPTLLSSPISAFNAKAVASLASVAGSAITRRLKLLIESLMDNIVTCKEPDRLEALNAAFDAVLLSVDEFDGLNTAMSLMLGLVKSEDHRKRASADRHLATFFAEAELDYSRYYADLIRALLISFDDRDSEVIKAAWTALSALTGRLRKEDMESLVSSTRQTLNQVGVPGHNLPGFLLPKGINAILPIFLQGLINGTAEQRTQSALAISEIIDKTNGDSLKPFVTQITGPLIRVVSERSTDVKAAILLTLNNLLEKIPTLLKPFLPQLQRTFTKSLADTTSEVLRSRAAKALGTLITMTPRIDPLIGELVTGSKTSDPGVKAAMQKALFEVVSKVGANMNDASRTAITGLIDEDSADADDATLIINARLFGALVKNLSPDVASGLIKTRVLQSHLSKPSVLSLNAVLLQSPETLTQSFPAETTSTICRGINNPDSLIAENCVLAAGKILLAESSNKSYDALKDIFNALGTAMQPGQSIDRRRLSLVVIRTVSRESNDLVRPHLPILAPSIFASVRDMIIPIKLSAEAAFLAIFCVVEEESAVFDKYLSGPGAELPANTKRSMQDYFKRVAVRLGSQARERREAEGGQGGLGLSNDEKEDEREVWSVGKVDLGETSFE